MTRKYLGLRCDHDFSNYLEPNEPATFAHEFGTNVENMVVIFDATDEEGAWQEEIYTLDQMNLPDCEDEMFVLRSLDNTHFCCWNVQTEWGRMIMTQDASPLAIWMTLKQAKYFNVEYIN